MGANHKVNAVTVFQDDDGAVFIRPNQAFREMLSKRC